MTSLSSSVSARRAAPIEVSATGRLHRTALPDGYLVRLGPRFLGRFHETFRRSPHATMLVVGPERCPTGFLVGTLDNDAHYRWLARSGSPQFAAALGAALVQRPTAAWAFAHDRLPRYARSLARRLKPDGETLVDASSDHDGSRSRTVAVLTHVAVAPHERGRGAGRALVDAFVEQAKQAGASQVRLITPTKTAAPAFYTALGWRSLGQRRAADGSLVEEFVITP